ncbi:hypothetical protein D4764_09G0002930 [Takifugu flavidus]|uniref:Uncharacterized protein n=1 Tax=Takifugu flavidus TaxID=433684 RepID=A0A5C6MJ93_9TELE|nr:hypothetical protein D4764_09G0002930 [Takifugu flavidus]
MSHAVVSPLVRSSEGGIGPGCGGGGESKETQPANHTSNRLKDDRRVSSAETQECSFTMSCAQRPTFDLHRPHNTMSKREALQET